MTTLRVKVCGLTRTQDVRAAAEAGVDWLGFNLWPGSRRYQTPEQVRALVASMPEWMRAVGVFVDATREAVERDARLAGLHAVQLHGDEQPQAWSGFPLPLIKALRVHGPESLEAADAWQCEALLLDAPGAAPGGNGVTFDWELAARLARMRPVLLAGGLHPDNVSEAVRRVRPLGVDVASGVEHAPGIKDAARMARFVQEARKVSRA